MQIGKFTVALLAMLAVACVPPESKSPKKSATPVVGAGKQDVPENRVNNQPMNNLPTNNPPVPPVNNQVSTTSCGDGIVDADEECDTDVDTTCLDLGFDGGYTSCSATCRVDVSACTRLTCGDGVVQSDETCDDGADNGSYGACNANCSGPAQYCGDGAVNGPETCDGAALQGVTCRSLGFDGGSIACDSSCELDTSSCSTCGDGVVGADEVCDDGALNGTYGNCNALCTGLGATCGDGVRNGPEACDGAQLGGATCASLGAGRGTPSCTSSCEFDLDACTLVPAVGEVIITEIMQNPAASLDADGEYFEVYNTTSSARDLDGCTVGSATASGPESFVIRETRLVGPGEYVVFARSNNAPFVADYVYNGAINLNNTVDMVAIICPQPTGPAVEIDQVSYDNGATFPNPEGASMSLNPNRMSATQNDLGSNWCESTTTFGVGDRGTPGAPNDFCF